MRLAAAAIAVWMILLALLALVEIQDPDFCFHVAWGRILSQDFAGAAHLTLGQDPDVARYAYSYWLYQILAAALYDVGPATVVASRLLLLLGTFLLAAVVAARRGATLRGIAPAFAAAVVVSEERFLDRPELLSFLLWTAALGLLLDGRTGRRAWPLLLLQTLWANVHPWFGLLPALWLSFAVGDRLDGRPRKLRSDALVLAGLLLAGSISPAGPRAWLGPLALARFLGGAGAPPFPIAEMMSPFASFQPSAAVWVFRIAAPVVLVAAWLARRRIGMGSVLTLVLAALLASAARRGMPLFALSFLALLPPGLDALSGVLARGSLGRRAGQAWLGLVAAVGVAGIVGIGTGMLFLLKDQDSRLGLRVSDSLPCWGAARFLAREKIEGPVFHPAVAAGPMLLENGARLEPYLDARWEGTRETLEAYRSIRSADDETIASVWDPLNGARGFQAVVLDFYEMPALLRLLAADPRWGILYRDPTAVVFARRHGANQQTIKKYEARLLLAAAGPDQAREEKLGRLVLRFLESRKPTLLEKVSFPFDAFYRANLALQLRSLPDAQVAYVDLLEREGGSLHWSRHRLEILNNLLYCLAGGEQHAAFAALLEALAREPSAGTEQRLTLQLHRARSLEQLGRSEEAEQLARAVAADGSASAEQRWAAWCRIASLRARAEDYQAAADALVRATRERPESAETYRSLGSLLDAELARPAEALAAYETFLRLGGRDSRIEQRAGELRAREGSRP
jgi:tetratricopeptide (TPR) repeat protein